MGFCNNNWLLGGTCSFWGKCRRLLVAAYGQILTLGNLMLHGRPLVNHCCNEESMDRLLIFCPVAHSMWMYMLQLFGIDWVMPSSTSNLLFCWYH